MVSSLRPRRSRSSPPAAPRQDYLAVARAFSRSPIDPMNGMADWRVAAMRPQIPVSGPIPLLLARPGMQFTSGTCCSCGGALDDDERYRCRPCVDAAVASLANPQAANPRVA